MSNRKSTDFIILNTQSCQACWKCVDACPEGVIGKVSVFFHKHAKIAHGERCMGCLQCIEACPQQAITALN